MRPAATLLCGSSSYSGWDSRSQGVMDPHLQQDILYMEEALREAAKAQAAGEVPVGAVVVRAGEIVGRGNNRNLRDHDASAHAEIVALRAAGAAVGNHRLPECELYVTIEPCPMCAGAMTHARI